MFVYNKPYYTQIDFGFGLKSIIFTNKLFVCIVRTLFSEACWVFADAQNDLDLNTKINAVKTMIIVMKKAE